MTNDQKQMTNKAWLPVPLLLAAIVVLWIANPQTSFESLTVVLGMNVFFAGLVSVCIASLAGRRFLATGHLGLLMFGSGALAWGTASVVSCALLNRSANVFIAIHNLGMLLSALLYLGGLAWRGRVRLPAVWLVAGYAGALSAVGFLTWAALTGHTPAFFTQGQGGTPLRQAVLAMTVTLYATTSALMLRSHRRQPSTFLYWYGLGLALMAVGVAGVMLQTIHGGLQGWTGRVSQCLGGAYLFVAALSAAREARTPRLSLARIEGLWQKDFTSIIRNHSLAWWATRYGVAVATVAASYGLRVAVVVGFGGHDLPPYIIFFPAIMVTALLAGPGPGLLATALAGLTAHIWILVPSGEMSLASPAERVGLTLFVISGAFMSAIAEIHQRIRSKAAAYDREAAVRESRDRLAAFASATFEGIGESENGRLVDCNEQLARLCGCTVAEMKGASISDFIAPEDRERVLAGIRQNQISVSEHAMIRKDGTRIEVETHGRPVVPGSSRRYTAVRDVTAQKRAEALERKAEALVFASQTAMDILQSMGEGVILLDLNGRIVSVNPAMERMSGISAGKSVGCLIQKLIPEVLNPQDQRLAMEALSVVLSGQLPEIPPLTLFSRTGDQVHVILSVSFVRDMDKQPREIVLTLRDVSALVQARRELEVSERKYRELVQNANSMIMRITPDHNITFFNEYAQAFFGYTEAEVIGRNVIGTITPAVDSEGRDLRELLWGIAAHPEQHGSNENENMCKDGRRVWVHWANKAILDQNGNVTELLCVGTDITERRRLQAQAARYQQRLLELAKRLASAEEQNRWRISRYIHDTIVQNLSLSHIRLGSLAQPLADAALTEESQKIHAIRALLDESIEECRMVMSDLTPALLYELGLIAALNGFARQLQEKHGAQVIIEGDGQELPLPRELRGLLFESARELIMNALKHAGPCEIRVAAHCPDGMLEIRVMDNGQGFDPSSGESATDHNGGFGTFSIRQRIEGLGGKLEIASNLGKGTIATIRLPIGH